MKLYFYTLLFILFALTPTSANELHYDLKVGLSPHFDIKGTNSITFRNKSNKPISEILVQLPLNEHSSPDRRIDSSRYDYSYPHGFEASSIKISKITKNQQNLKFEYIYDENPGLGSTGKNNYARIILNKPLYPNKTIVFSINFTSKIPTKFANGKFNEVLYLQGMWYPTVCDTNDKGEFKKKLSHFKQATYSIEIKCSPNIKVVTGAQLSKTSSENTKAIYKGDVKNRITMLPLVASTRFNKYSSIYKDITIDSYYLPGEEKSASMSIQITKEALAFYENFYDLTLPAKHISIVENYMGGASAYSAGNTVFMPIELRKFPKIFNRIYEVILVHEISHMWWGLTVSYGFNQDNWIGEGLSTFFMNRYFENKYGKYHNMLNTQPGSSLPNYTYEEVASYLPYRSLAMSNQDPPPASSRENSDNLPALSTIQYQKGYYIFKILYQKMGDEKFLALLKHLIKNYSTEILTTQGLLEVINEISGEDYTELFSNWVYDNKKVDYQITSCKSQINPSLNYRTIVKIENKNQIKASMPIQLIDKENQIHTKITSGENTEYVEFISTAPMKEVVLDPNRIYPDITRVDNYYPRRYKIKKYLSIPESDSYYLYIEPSVAVSNFGSYAALKGSYGYLDDFNMTMQINTDSNYFNISAIKNRFWNPNTSLIGSSSQFLGVSSLFLGVNHKLYHTEEQITYPGTNILVGFAAEDLYKYELADSQINLYGYYSYIDIVKTTTIKKLLINISGQYGLTPLSHFSYNYQHDLNRKFLGSEINFEQAKLFCNKSMRIGHLKSLSLQSDLRISKDTTPTEKNYYLLSSKGLRAVPRNYSVNSNDRNLAIFKLIYKTPLVANIYENDFFKEQFWLESIYISYFHEWGTLSSSVKNIFEEEYLKAAGMKLDINILNVGSMPIQINLTWARPITKKNNDKEFTFFWLGINGLF